MNSSYGNNFQKTIWIFWYDGWENAPEITKKCLSTWYNHNTEWSIVELNKDNFSDFVNLNFLIPELDKKNIPYDALSDIIRISLLKKYGGVWVDSTLYCNEPLDKWLPGYFINGFFAFAYPGPDRPLTSWFLAGNTDSYIVNKWYIKTIDYWSDRLDRHHYFWFHYQFKDLYNEDSAFKIAWDKIQKIYADGPHYFVPYPKKFSRRLTRNDKKMIDSPSTPVFKLTYKYNPLTIKEKSVLTYLLNPTSFPNLSFYSRIINFLNPMVIKKTILSLKPIRSILTTTQMRSMSKRLSRDA
jgi:hypothetical protein